VTDGLERVTALLAEVGACYQRGRRYRAIANDCEARFFEPALDVGSEIRVAERRGTLAPEAVAVAVGTLEDLLTACRAAIAAAQSSPLYQRALVAWAAEDWSRVGELAPALFAAVERYEQCPTLHHAVPLAAGRRGAEHFISAAECASHICAALEEGLTPARNALELGADEMLRALTLDDDPANAESPITLAIDPVALIVPVCRIVPGGEALVYGARLRVPMRVECASAVTDEWWMVRPDAYRRYVDELEAELTARGVALERAAPAS
jgi:hypothetical protein